MDGVLAVGGVDAAVDVSRTNHPQARTSTHQPATVLIPRQELMYNDIANSLIERLRVYQMNQADTHGEQLIRRAYAIAYEKHDGQKRRSGEPYIDHPVAVACILLDLQLDPASVAAALLHDVIEDTGTSREQLELCFGRDVASLVDGVTKMTSLENESKEDLQAGTYRKMFLAMADNPRVVLVKLADRLHNMRTIQHMKPESQRRIARETMEIYAPLAHRVGIWQIKSELEDRSFQILEPEKYSEIEQQLAIRSDQREKLIQRTMLQLRRTIEQLDIKADVTGRPKHIYSIYRKMVRKGVGLDQIYDQLAVRVIIGEASLSLGKARNTRNPWKEQDPYLGACYQVLGVVHSLWSPVPGEFDDYIANPKESLYQSLHTTVLLPGGRACEIQIRTQNMHLVAEYGIAAHWRYKEGFKKQDVPIEEKLRWLNRLHEWRSSSDNWAFVEWLKKEELNEQIYVLTPKGEIIQLPVGSTPVDFAYRIHSQLGERIVGARVNKKMVSLDCQLKDSEIVEILTSKTPRAPSRDWLNFVKTSTARNHIRRYFKRLAREDNITAGRELLEKELKRLSLSVLSEEVTHLSGFRSLEELYEKIGSGELTARQVTQKILSQQIHQDDELAKLPQVAPQPERKDGDFGIHVRGDGSMPTRLAKCCNPVISEPIVGFVTRGKGITVHRADCRTILNEPDRGRLIEVSWGAAHKQQGFPVPVQIESWDRVGLWRDIAAAIADSGINIEAIEQVPTRKRDRSLLRVVLTIKSVAELTSILDRINSVTDVIEAHRLTTAH
jgi:GTP pyrophosphokinase